MLDDQGSRSLWSHSMTWNFFNASKNLLDKNWRSTQQNRYGKPNLPSLKTSDFPIQDTVMILLERVTEAQRVAAMDLRDSLSSGGGGGKSGKGGTKKHRGHRHERGKRK